MEHRSSSSEMSGEHHFKNVEVAFKMLRYTFRAYLSPLARTYHTWYRWPSCLLISIQTLLRPWAFRTAGQASTNVAFCMLHSLWDFLPLFYSFRTDPVFVFFAIARPLPACVSPTLPNYLFLIGFTFFLACIWCALTRQITLRKVITFLLIVISFLRIVITFQREVITILFRLWPLDFLFSVLWQRTAQQPQRRTFIFGELFVFRGPAVGITTTGAPLRRLHQQK